LVHSSSWYVYLFSLHVSDDYVPIIRRNFIFLLFFLLAIRKYRDYTLSIS